MLHSINAAPTGTYCDGCVCEVIIKWPARCCEPTLLIVSNAVSLTSTRVYACCSYTCITFNTSPFLGRTLILKRAIFHLHLHAAVVESFQEYYREMNNLWRNHHHLL